MFIGGELGLLGGGFSARRTVTRDPESRRRIENAFRRFRADVLREEAKKLDGQASEGSSLLDGFGGLDTYI